MAVALDEQTCAGTTKRGRPCGQPVVGSSAYCRWHGGREDSPPDVDLRPVGDRLRESLETDWEDVRETLWDALRTAETSKVSRCREVCSCGRRCPGETTVSFPDWKARVSAFEVLMGYSYGKPATTVRVEEVTKPGLAQAFLAELEPETRRALMVFLRLNESRRDGDSPGYLRALDELEALIRVAREEATDRLLELEPAVIDAVAVEVDELAA